jgi:hypothetical protein
MDWFLRLLNTRYGDPDAAVPPIAKSFCNRHHRVLKSPPKGCVMPPVFPNVPLFTKQARTPEDAMLPLSLAQIGSTTRPHWSRPL